MSTAPGWNNLSTSQKAALIDLSYNGGYFYGCGRCDSLDRAMKNGNYDDIGLIFQKYDNGDEIGLSRRRYAEWLIWQGTDAETAYKKAWAFTSVSAIMQNLT